MKLGDLVVLSSYGRARKFNNRITLNDPFQTGLVIGVRENAMFPYTVLWSMPVYHPKGIGHTRRELSYAKIKK